MTKTSGLWQSTLMGVALSVACAMGASSQTAETSADIVGRYDVTGTNEDGGPYQGELEVTRHGEVYQFHWNVGEQYEGIGVQNGSVVAVAFSGVTDGNGETWGRPLGPDCGVVTYNLLADGTLDGKWGYWGVNEAGTERAVLTRGSSLAGVYDMTGHNPDGREYQGKISVEPAGAGYKFAWSNNTSGFGIKQGEVVSVGIGPHCGFVAYEIKPGGVLDGAWGSYGISKTGTERATRSK